MHRWSLAHANPGIEKLGFFFCIGRDLEVQDFQRYQHAARSLDDTGLRVRGNPTCRSWQTESFVRRPSFSRFKYSDNPSEDGSPISSAIHREFNITNQWLVQAPRRRAVIIRCTCVALIRWGSRLHLDQGVAFTGIRLLIGYYM